MRLVERMTQPARLLDERDFAAQRSIEDFVEHIELELLAGDRCGMLAGEHDCRGGGPAGGERSLFRGGLFLPDQQRKQAQIAVSPENWRNDPVLHAVPREYRGGWLGHAAAGIGLDPFELERATGFQQRHHDRAGGNLAAGTGHRQQAAVATDDEDIPLRAFRQGGRQISQRFAGDREFHQSAAGLTSPALRVTPFDGYQMRGLALEQREIGIERKLNERNRGEICGRAGSRSRATGKTDRRDAEPGELPDGSVEGQAFVEARQHLRREKDELATTQVTECRRARARAGCPGDFPVETLLSGDDGRCLPVSDCSMMSRTVII